MFSFMTNSLKCQKVSKNKENNSKGKFHFFGLNNGLRPQDTQIHILEYK